MIPYQLLTGRGVGRFRTGRPVPRPGEMTFRHPFRVDTFGVMSIVFVTQKQAQNQAYPSQRCKRRRTAIGRDTTTRTQARTMHRMMAEGIIRTHPRSRLLDKP